MEEPIFRKQLFSYAEEKYGSEAEYLWANAPYSAVLRNLFNRKWYAIAMRVAGNKLGLKTENPVAIVSVKCDPVLREFLLQREGYFPAYHLNKRTWITASLEGDVPFEELCRLIDMSYSLVSEAKRPKKQV